MPSVECGARAAIYLCLFMLFVYVNDQALISLICEQDLKHVEQKFFPTKLTDRLQREHIYFMLNCNWPEQIRS